MFVIGSHLKSKMKAMDIMNSTMAPAQALEKATENTEIQKSTSLEANLRISNLKIPYKNKNKNQTR
jgi:hypothetical protein